MESKQMIVMDTCAIIWLALNPTAISKKAKNAINNANDHDGMIFCEISLWEIAMLTKKGRIDPKTNYQHFIELILTANNYHLQGIDTTIAEIATNLPNNINQDPADRIISATSIAKSADLITSDNNLRQAKQINTIW